MKFMLLALLNISLLAPLGAIDKPAAEGEALWQPEVGEFWVYEVVLELPKESKLSKLEQFDDKREVTYRETSVYQGLLPMEQDGAKAHVFHVSNGEQLVEIQYVEIRNDAIEMLGSKKEGKSPKNAVMMGKPIPLMLAEWKGGEAFAFEMGQPVAGGTLRHKKQFRVLGWEDVETKAGKFKAMHVQIIGQSGPVETKASYWFAPGTGFIKEVSKSYIAEKVIFTEAKELVQTGKQEPGKE
jgi:hypothetical protein